LHPFEYVRATSVDEAISALAKHGERARPLAGGTDALVMARAGRWELDALVDVKHIPETNVLELGSSEFRLGAAVACYRVYEDEKIAAAFPGLVDSVSIIGGIQIQSRAGLGGNLCNASPSGDGIPSLIVHNTTCVIAGPNGTREVAVEDFCTGPGRSVIGNGEFLVEMKMPAPKKGFGAAYQRFTPRNEMDIAVAGVASSVQLDGNTIVSARVALAAVGPTPILSSAGDLLAGKEATADNISAAAQAASADASPISDMRGTDEQRKHLVGVLTRRTLERAVERARENS
jgi:CO/xanthine dehydrogenase FAD-binding subunit